MSASTLPTFQGPRVRLRPPADGDVAARFALGRDPGIAEMFGASRDRIRPLTEADAAAWVRRVAGHPHGWIIEHGRLLGEIRLDNLDPRDRSASLAIGILDSAALGQGLGTEAIRLLLGYAFGPLALHRIGIRVLAYNRRAIRAYEKCGFRIEGRERETAFVNGHWHDDVIMGLLDHEFAAPNAGLAQPAADPRP